MEFKATVDSLADVLASVGRCEVSKEEKRFIFKPGWNDVKAVIFAGVADIDSLLHNVRAKEMFEATALHDETSYEVVVREESSVPFRRFRENRMQTIDHENGLSYEISPPSDEYLSWLTVCAAESGSTVDYGLGVMLGPRFRQELTEGTCELSIFEYIRKTSFRIMTLKIQSQKPHKPRDFNRLTHAFLFQVAYNLDIAFVPYRSLEQMSRRGRITQMRRSEYAELDPPRRSYLDDLIHHYLLGVSTDSAVVEFLSYYHVLEHFFEAVFNDELIDRVRTCMTHPGFSYRRKKDIRQLIDLIRKSLQIRSEEITFSESEALRLCLGHFIDLTQLVEKLEEYDPELVDYYAQNKVPFSEGATVKLRNDKRDDVLRDLCNRIYATRNALVHSKETEKARYRPFADEKPLLRELPLLRFISEMVILSQSSPL